MTTKPNIVHLIISLNNGGCENQMLRVLPLVTQFRHTIITLRDEGTLADQFKKAGIEVIALRQRSMTDLSSYRKLLSLLKSIQPKLVITYLVHADLIGRTVIRFFSRYRAIPSLRTTHNHPRYRLARVMERLTRPLVSHYLANSEAVKDFYVSRLGVKAEKITVIPNGIDQHAMKSVTVPRDYKSTLGLSPDALVLTCVANLHPYKGYPYLLEAFEQAYVTRPDLELLIVGEGSERETLEKQIFPYRSKWSIHFLGRRNDVSAILKITDLFVFPTLFEGMSNAVMEAMAAGKAIITTDIPENKLLLQEAAVFVAPKNANQLAEAILTTSNNHEKIVRLGKAAADIIEKEYALPIVSQKLSRFYNSAANRSILKP